MINRMEHSCSCLIGINIMRSDKMLSKPYILSLFTNLLNKFNTTLALMYKILYIYFVHGTLLCSILILSQQFLGYMKIFFFLGGGGGGGKKPSTNGNAEFLTTISNFQVQVIYTNSFIAYTIYQWGKTV